MPRKIIGGPSHRVFVDGGSLALSEAITLPSAASDSFGRQRVSEPYTLFDSQLEYGLMPLYWESVTATGGTVTHLPNSSSARMRVTGTSGSSVVRQTKRYFRYQPGKSQKITSTFVLGAHATSVRRRVGYFDARNGLFLEQSGGQHYFVRRTYTSGVVVDNPVAQSDWNIDKMDGTGVSGVTLDFSKSQILLIDLEWLGVGSVRLGFVVNGAVYYCHQMNHANNINDVYMTTANLPVRYEIENTGAGDGNADLIQICSEVSSEGGIQERAQVFSAATGATLKTVSNTLIPVMSIRAGTVFPGAGSIINRSTVIPLVVDVFSEDASVFFSLLYNPVLTNASWQNYSTTHSGVQTDVAASALSGGLQIASGYVPQAKQSTAAMSIAVESEIAVTLNVAGTVGDILTVAAIRVGGSDSDVGVSITWKELY